MSTATNPLKKQPLAEAAINRRRQIRNHQWHQFKEIQDLLY